MKKVPYSKIKEMVMKPITKRDIEFFSTFMGGVFYMSIEKQEKIIDKILNNNKK